MNYPDISILLASIVAGAAPIVIATLGETITEKGGVINLSLDGTILLSAMAGFAVTVETGSLGLGFLAASAVGGLVALIVGVFSIYMGLSQVAVGFVLTLMTRDLAYFLGNAYSRIPGPQVTGLPIPYLSEIPFLGPILFGHSVPVYLSLLLIPMVVLYFDHTAWGLQLKAIGENPAAVYARGTEPRRFQLLYTLIGGMLAGVGGASFSLLAKPGWGRPQGSEGTGWIVLALVIFGGWRPLRAAAGAYFFAFLQVIGIYFQEWFPNIPAQLFQVAPFPLMIFTLVIVHLAQKEAVLNWAEEKAFFKLLLQKMSGTQPTSLGKPYIRDRR